MFKYLWIVILLALLTAVIVYLAWTIKDTLENTEYDSIIDFLDDYFLYHFDFGMFIVSLTGVGIIVAFIVSIAQYFGE